VPFAGNASHDSFNERRKNLIVFGENGSGNLSLYHVRAIFSTADESKMVITGAPSVISSRTRKPLSK